MKWKAETKSLTGKVFVRLHYRFFGRPLIVVQVEEKTIAHGEILFRWSSVTYNVRDAVDEDLVTLKKINPSLFPCTDEDRKGLIFDAMA